MPTRSDIKQALRTHLEAVKAARLAKFEATAPRFTVYNEPVDYQYVARVLADALGALAPDLVQRVTDDLNQQYEQGYPLVEHTHSWAAIIDKPGVYPPEQHRHEDVESRLDALAAELGEARVRSVRWQEIEGKPTTFKPIRHTHPLPEELLQLLIMFSEQGRPGQVLMRTSTGLAWRDVPVNAVYSQIGGGGGGGSGADGDMRKAVYDTDDDGIVDAAGTAPWEGISDKPASFVPDSHASTHEQGGSDAIETLGQVTVQPLADGTMVFTVKNATGTINVLAVDTTNGKVIIDGDLEVSGAIYAQSVSATL